MSDVVQHEDTISPPKLEQFGLIDLKDLIVAHVLMNI